MKLSALTLIVGTVALLYVASTQSRPAAAATPSGPLCTMVNGVLTLKVSVLKLPFNPEIGYTANPTPANPTYSPPQPDPAISIDPNLNMGTDLRNAFVIAPAFFQQQLCNLDGVFINPQGCNNFGNTNVCTDSGGNPLGDAQVVQVSWGFREGPWQFAPASTHGHYGRYIAISAGPWSTQTSHAPTYSMYKLMILQLLLPWADTVVPTFATNPANPGQDTPAMAVLAVLAHEFGHVLWYDTFRPIPGGSYDFNTFCRGTFFRNSWRSVDPPPLWREFGDTQNEHGLDDTNIADIALAITRHSIRPGHAGDLLHEIYKRGAHWASLFGAFSPDEDFIETYALYVLTQGQANPPLKSLQITITGAASGQCSKQPNGVCKDDIPGDLNSNFKPELMRKSNCIAQLVNPNP